MAALKRSVGQLGLDLHDVDRSVAATLATGRLGRPRSVRWIVNLAERTDPLPTVSMLTACVAGWFGGAHLHQQSFAGDAQQRIELLSWAKGQAALLVVSAAGPMPASHLVVLGEQGAIYHDAGTGAVIDA